MTYKFKLALTFGRFNLLHKGHIDLFKQMAGSATEVVIGISTGEKNLSLKDRRQVIAHALSQDEDFNVPYQINPKRQPFELMAEIKMYEPGDVVVFFGQDQYELAKAFETHAGVASILIPRLTSSTEIRTLIDNEEWSMLSKHVPMSILNKVVQLRETEKCLVSN